MDLRSGYPLWLVRSGLPYSYPKLDRKIRTDTIVLGGGISGALLAHHLTEAGLECVVIDGRTIGLGSTCASTALLQYQVDLPLVQLIRKVGKERAVKAYQLCAESIDQLETLCHQIGFADFERRKTLYFASYKKDAGMIREEFDLHRALGFNVQLLEAASIRRHFGFDSEAAVYSDHSAQTDSYLLTHALLQYNLPRGLSVYDRSPVVNIVHRSGKVWLTTANDSRIEARRVIFATGYESVNYLRKKVVQLHSTYAVASEQTLQRKFWKDDCLIWETKRPYLYITTVHGNRIMIGGRDEPFYSPAKRDRLIGTKTRQLSRDFGKLFPHVEFIPEFRWTGTFGETKDGLPYIGPDPDHPNHLFALGFGGNGITFSLIAARLLTDFIKGKKNQASNLFAFNR